MSVAASSRTPQERRRDVMAAVRRAGEVDSKPRASAVGGGVAWGVGRRVGGGEEEEEGEEEA